ncbi:peptidylprolyl isomerase [Pelagicoccus albus]|uniref:Peptidyl-prolyl cis-trans isomerase n=1 Tax=Pelagicoccus albus TaxID=415222 RepID=A0A7X1B8C6_9BACT|nr:peptidylprolyl isomerase [Pelagicoccus albus]MBC2607559.1 peptidylprolyl isomerase [Pelagicoccus albus]
MCSIRTSNLYLIISAGLLLAALSGCAKKETQYHATIRTNMGEIVVRLFETDAPKTVKNFMDLADGTRFLKDGESVAQAKPFYDGLIFHRVIPDFMIQGGDPLGTGMGGPGYTFEDETYTPGLPMNGVIETEERAKYVFQNVVAPHLREYRGESPIEFIADLYSKMEEARGYEPMFEIQVQEVLDALEYQEPLLDKGELLNHVDYGTLCMANSGPNTNGSQFFIVTNKEGTPWLDGKHTVFGKVISGMEVAEAISKVETDPNDKPLEDVIIESIRVAPVEVEVEKRSSTE